MRIGLSGKTGSDFRGDSSSYIRIEGSRSFLFFDFDSFDTLETSSLIA